jgi:hypothetical protein
LTKETEMMTRHVNPVAILVLLFVVAGGCADATQSPGDTDEQESADPAGKADWVGNRGNNERCSWDWQCRADAGLICRPSSFAAGKPELRCQPRGGAEAPCAEDTDCKSGTICLEVDHFLTSNEIQQAGRCQEGTAKPCDGDDDCEETGSVCRPSSSVYAEPDYRCQVLGDEGALCVDEGDCVSGLACRGMEYFSLANREVGVPGTCKSI